MNRLAVAAAALATALAAGCAGSGGDGRATLWVTRDQGSHVLLVRAELGGAVRSNALP